MIKKDWEEFRNTGLLWLINTILHIFGWAIVVMVDEDHHAWSAYPARVDYRGFSEKDNGEGYEMVTKYISETASELMSDISGDNE